MYLFILSLLLMSCNNPNVLKGDRIYEFDENGIVFEYAQIFDANRRLYSFKDFDTLDLKKLQNYLRTDTSNNVVCLKDKNN